MHAVGTMESWENGSHTNYHVKINSKNQSHLTKNILESIKGVVFLYRIVTGDEKWVHNDNPNRELAWFDRANHRLHSQNEIVTARRPCYGFGGSQR